MSKKQGGYAFPTVGREEAELQPSGDRIPVFTPAQDGMTLLDYFAAKALSGMLANQGESVRSNDDVRAIADFSYNVAEAMLVARKGRA